MKGLAGEGNRGKQPDHHDGASPEQRQPQAGEGLSRSGNPKIELNPYSDHAIIKSWSVVHALAHGP
jgi:hypothetical protein